MLLLYCSPKYIIYTEDFREPPGIDCSNGIWVAKGNASHSLEELVPATFNFIEPIYHLIIQRGHFKFKRSSMSYYITYGFPDITMPIDKKLIYIEDKIY